jgi:hypothetical protein
MLRRAGADSARYVAPRFGGATLGQPYAQSTMRSVLIFSCRVMMP